jgi:hypothetical protein
VHYHNNRFDSESDENFGELLDEAVERVARDAQSLAEQFDQAVERLVQRHKLARAMAATERFANIPTKILERRLALIQQILAVDYLADEDCERLKQRLQCLETIRRFEPGEPTPIKKLRERARLLERVVETDFSRQQPHKAA